MCIVNQLFYIDGAATHALITGFLCSSLMTSRIAQFSKL